MKKNRDTEEEIRKRVAKAPLWIQDLAKTLFRQRDEARAELAEHKNSTKPSPFYVRNYGGAAKEAERFYVQTNTIHVEHAGIVVEVSVGRPSWDEKSVHIRFDAVPSGVQDVVLIPLASNCIDIRAAQHLRIDSYNSEDLAKKMSKDIGENQDVIFVILIHSDPSKGETYDVIIENKQPEPFPSTHRQPR